MLAAVTTVEINVCENSSCACCLFIIRLKKSISLACCHHLNIKITTLKVLINASCTIPFNVCSRNSSLNFHLFHDFTDNAFKNNFFLFALLCYHNHDEFIFLFHLKYGVEGNKRIQMLQK